MSQNHEPKKLKIFISYAWRADTRLEIIREKDPDFWMDAFFKELKTHRKISGIIDRQEITKDNVTFDSVNSLSEQIEKGITSSDLFIAVLSREYFESYWCKSEIEKYTERLNSKNCMIGVILDDQAAARWKEMFPNIMYVDFREISSEGKTKRVGMFKTDKYFHEKMDKLADNICEVHRKVNGILDEAGSGKPDIQDEVLGELLKKYVEYIEDLTAEMDDLQAYIDIGKLGYHNFIRQIREQVEESISSNGDRMYSGGRILADFLMESEENINEILLQVKHEFGSNKGRRLRVYEILNRFYGALFIFTVSPEWVDENHRLYDQWERGEVPEKPFQSFLSSGLGVNTGNGQIELIPLLNDILKFSIVSAGKIFDDYNANLPATAVNIDLLDDSRGASIDTDQEDFDLAKLFIKELARIAMASDLYIKIENLELGDSRFNNYIGELKAALNRGKRKGRPFSLLLESGNPKTAKFDKWFHYLTKEQGKAGFGLNSLAIFQSQDLAVNFIENLAGSVASMMEVYKSIRDFEEKE